MSRDITPYRRRRMALLLCAIASVGTIACKHLPVGSKGASGFEGDVSWYEPEDKLTTKIANVAIDDSTGDLPGSIGRDRSTGEEFLKFAHHKWYFGWERPRKCVGAPGCRSGATKGRMRVEAIKAARLMSAKAVKTGDVLMARILNVSLVPGVQDVTYPECVATARGVRTECYLVLSPVPKDTSFIVKLAILTVADADHSKFIDLKVVNTKRTFKSCNHPNTQRPSRADFRGCETFPGEEGADEYDARDEDGPGAHSMAAFMNAYETQFAWMSCAEGCCSA